MVRRHSGISLHSYDLWGQYFPAVKIGVTIGDGSPVDPMVFGWRHTPVEGKFPTFMVMNKSNLNKFFSLVLFF